MLSWSSENRLIVFSSLLYRWCLEYLWCDDNYFIGWKLNLIACAGLSSADQHMPCSNQQAARQSSSQPVCLLCPTQLTNRACSPKAVWCDLHHTLAPSASSLLLRLRHGLMPMLRRLVSLWPAHLPAPTKVCLRLLEIQTCHIRLLHLFDGRLGSGLLSDLYLVVAVLGLGRAFLPRLVCYWLLVTAEVDPVCRYWCPFVVSIFTQHQAVGLVFLFLYFFLLNSLVIGRCCYFLPSLKMLSLEAVDYFTDKHSIFTYCACVPVETSQA